MTAKVVPIEPYLPLYLSGLELYRRGGLPRGSLPGWPPLDELYSVSPGQWTVVTGVPGSGKSEFLDALLVNLAEKEPWSFAVYSPENCPTETHLVKLVEKRVRKPFGEGPNPRMSEQEYADGAYWVMDKFFWMSPDLKTPDELIAVALSYKRPDRRLGIVLDPWNTLEHVRAGMTETDYVSFILTEVTKLARGAGAHIWLVVHPQKLYKNKDGTRSVPTPYDISGCYSDDTDVLTTRGWIPHSEVRIDDGIGAFDPVHEAMFIQKPTRIIRKPYAGPMHHFKGERYDLLVTPEHRMLLRPKWGPGEWDFMEAADVPLRRFEIPVDGGGLTDELSKENNHTIIDHYEDTVWCLTVPTGAYFVRRNGKASVCGNSSHWYNKADNIITVHRDQADRESQAVELHVQKIRFKHVGRAGLAKLMYDRVTGRYFYIPSPIVGVRYVDPERNEKPPVLQRERQPGEDDE